MEPDVYAIPALLSQGNFEEAEAHAYAALRSTTLDNIARHELTLHHATACLKQLEYGRAVEIALGLLHSHELSVSTQILTTRLICIAFSNLAVPELALPYIARIEPMVTTSPHCSDRCWPGRFQMMLGNNKAALDCFRRALLDFPGHHFARLYIGIARMALGDTGGLEETLEFCGQEFFRMFYPHTADIDRMWQGEALEGKSITLVPHGGYGDYFQFIRFVPALRRAGVREIIAVVNGPCHGLIASSGVDRVIADVSLDVVNANNYWTSIFGLERLCLTGESRSASGAYLTAPASTLAQERAATIRARAQGRVCLGIYWHSDAQGGEEKSLALHDILPLFALESVHWVILQRGYGLRQLYVSGLDAPMSVLEEALTFDEVAAIMTRLDGMVTICAWPLHLAGSLGLRTWLLAGRALNYRHLNREHASVLYPDTVTLVRQPICGDWRYVIRALSTELRQWISELIPRR